MIAYVSVLALFFFTIASSQVTYWTGNGANSTITNSDNWSNGVPTATSIVYINETTCNGCTVTFDVALTVAELHLGALTGTGPDVEITGVALTITTAFSLGSPSPTTYYSASVTLNAGATLEIGAACTATIYYTGGTPIGSDTANNWLINRGNITVVGNGGITAGSYDTLYIGTGSSYPLWIENYGSWTVTDQSVELRFYYLGGFNFYSGSIWGSWLATTGTSTPSIVFYGTDVVLQPSGLLGATPPTFGGAIYFYSTNTQSFTDYSTVPPNALTFNTTGVTVSDSLFYGTNIVFLFDGWLQDCNITSYALVNSSSTVSGVHAYLTGNTWLDYAVFAGVNTDFIVQVEYEATVYMITEFALTGSVTLINNGTWIWDSSDYLYFDVQAIWVNTGLTSVINHYNDYIYGTEFPGLSAYTDAGTMVNLGTIEFTNGGGINFEQATGTFLQGKYGIMKFGYGSDYTSPPGTVTLPNVMLDGYVGIHNSDPLTPLDGVQLFTFIFDPTAIIQIFSGSLSITTDALTVTPKVCYEVGTSSPGYFTIYKPDITDLTCPSGYSTYISVPILNGDALSSLPAAIVALQDQSVCTAASTGCGSIPTGTPSGGGPSGSSAAGSLAVPLAFLVSMVCLLLKF